MNFNGAQVLVTGANGFLGSHLIRRLLEEGAVVHAFIHGHINNIEGLAIKEYEVDITDFNAVNKAVEDIKPSIVFHLAAYTNPSRDVKNKVIAFKINHQGTVNLLEALKACKITMLVNVSTAEVYGDAKAPFTEDMPLRPVSPYSMSKAAAEAECMTAHKVSSLPVTTLRLTLVYGPMQETNRFLPELIRACIQGEELKMTKGEQKRDFIYVDDVIEALLAAAMNQNASGQTFNISTGKSYRISDVARIVNNLTGDRAKLNLGALPYRDNEIWDYRCDITKARKILGWKPKVNFEDGLKRTINWYQSNL